MKPRASIPATLSTRPWPAASAPTPAASARITARRHWLAPLLLAARPALGRAAAPWLLARPRPRARPAWRGSAAGRPAGRHPLARPRRCQAPVFGRRPGVVVRGRVGRAGRGFGGGRVAGAYRLARLG